MKNHDKKSAEPAEPSVPKTLDDFIHFMDSNKYGAGWVLANKTNDLVTYEKTYKAASGNWFIALILLLFFIVPGIIYMVYARRSARTVRLTVVKKADGTLVPSGDREGLSKFNKFSGVTTSTGKFLGTRAGKWVVAAGIIFILYLLGAWLGK